MKTITVAPKQIPVVETVDVIVAGPAGIGSVGSRPQWR